MTWEKGIFRVNVNMKDPDQLTEIYIVWSGILLYSKIQLLRSLENKTTPLFKPAFPVQMDFSWYST